MEYLSAEEKANLQQQLSERQALRKALSDRIGTARALGDLKENAEYHAAREDQGMNEMKIRQLEERLATAVVVDDEAAVDDLVMPGATVRLRDVSTKDEDLYRLVGEPADDPSSDYIEVTQHSPMGQALMRSHVGEVIRVDLPRGEKRFEIVAIE